MTEKKKAGPESGKKPYRKPRLEVHGDVRAITRTKNGSANDGAGKPRTKSTGSGA